VSAEAIRFALRRRLGESEETNRSFNEAERVNEWRDADFKRWEPKSKEAPFVDDDLLGYMSAKAAAEDEDHGSAKVRRSVLEVTRAVSLSPWAGDVTFNAASPGATPSAQKKGKNPVPYGTELHATRYQYGFAMTPERLAAHPAKRAELALRGLCGIGEVAGNHGRFLFDFSPESVVFRISHEAAPRILYSFNEEAGRVSVAELLRKVKAGDVKPGELVLGGAIVDAFAEADRAILKGAELHSGVVAACESVCRRLAKELKA
jgi:CRISPR-associated protein Cst2